MAICLAILAVVIPFGILALAMWNIWAGICVFFSMLVAATYVVIGER